MIIQPKVRGFICTTAHPTGCAANVEAQIQFVKAQAPLKTAPKRVLIIGASTGYGLASRIALAFGGKAETIGVFFERPAEGKRTATAGWYNTVAFEAKAHEAGLYAKSINGDAFSDEIKQQTLDLIEKDWGGQVDCVIYSLASPRRIHPKTGQIYNSVLKPIGETVTSKTVDVLTGEVKSITIEPANQQEIADTVAVMGGEDWRLWIEALLARHLLAPGVKTVAYSYLGPELTHAIYWKGTIGAAKKDLQATTVALNALLKPIQGEAWISVNKALVTQASSAIPIVPLYVSILYKVMKNKGTHEGAIEQAWRLFAEKITNGKVLADAQDLIRLDDYELDSEVQAEVARIWPMINTENINELSDLVGYRRAFYQLFGFEVDGIAYDAEVEA